MKPTIIIVTYNRPASLKRLLSFISNSFFESLDINLVISIDYQNSKKHEEILNIAKGFDWKYGIKKIIEHTFNLGLKAHVLSCGDLSEEFGAVIVLEDDIIVSPFFYDYALKSLEVYKDDTNIAGISLYGFEWSQVPNRLFTPAHNGADVYFIQNAQSWGQLWSQRMWYDFKEWYLANKCLDMDSIIPDNVRSWSDKSWLKYHVQYCIEKNKYFVYPYVSLTSNYGDMGEHAAGIKYFQVPILAHKKINYAMPEFDVNSYKYDAFFERQGLADYLGIEDSNLCIDLYGSKKNRQRKKYWLTSSVRNFKVVKSFGLELRPHELNVIYNVPGKEIYLYDTDIKVKNKTDKGNAEAKKTLYDIKEVPSRKLFEVIRYRIYKKIAGNMKSLKL